MQCTIYTRSLKFAGQSYESATKSRLTDSNCCWNFIILYEYFLRQSLGDGEWGVKRNDIV